MLDTHGNQEHGVSSHNEKLVGETPISSILSMPDACRLLRLSEEELLQKISQGNICATKGSVTGMWLIDGNCVRSLMRQAGLETGECEFSTSDAEKGGVSADAQERDNESPFDCSVTATDSDAVEYLDMAPPHDHTDSGPPIMPITPVIKPIAINARPAENYFTRQVISARNLQELLEGLEFTHERLQGAMYRIGFLENQVENLEDRLKTLPEFRARAARGILIEKENRDLKDAITLRDQELIVKEESIAEKDERICEMERALSAANEKLTKIESQWLAKVMKAFGFQVG